MTGVTALACFAITFLSFVKGDRKFDTGDWLSLAWALVALALWQLAKNPLAAVVLVTLTDAFSFIPTFRKGYKKPHEEKALTYTLSGLKFIFGIFALQSFSLVTWLYPASLVVTNLVFVAMILWRRASRQR